MKYRIHIDIPLDQDEEGSIEKTKQIIDYLVKINESHGADIEKINYRLGYDDDRQKSNYLNKNENGHVNNKKSTLTLGKSNV